MSPVAALLPIDGVVAAPVLAVQPGAVADAPGFGRMLMDGLQSVGDKLEAADTLVRRFAIDDSVPVHQVTVALEEARLAVELAVQVRGRLVEGYRELMNMQL